MKKILLFLFLAIISCKQKTKQQIAEELVEKYLHISNNPEAIKKIKFTNLSKTELSNGYEIAVGIEVRVSDSSKTNHRIVPTIFILNKDLTKVETLFSY